MNVIPEAAALLLPMQRVIQRRWALILAVATLLWFVVWLALPLLFDPEIPSDNLEQLDWANHPAWGYAKHPPFPTWILWCFERVVAPSLGLTYFIGALQVAFLLWMAWLLARYSLRGVATWIAPLMVACITYYSSRMHYYNHNTALMTAYAASLYALWRAINSRSMHWWLLLGLGWGIGMLSKYQMALLISCNVAFLWSVRAQGTARLLKGLALACAVAAAVLAPHLLWLVRNHFPSFDYASVTLSAHLGPADRARDVLYFLLHQLGRIAPLAVLLAALVWRARTNAPDHTTSTHAGAHLEVARRFWLIHAWGPIAGIVVIGLVLGAAVENHWGMASLWAMPFWILSTERGRRWAAVPAVDVTLIALAVQAAMVVGYLAGY